ncbi:MAG TPA: histidine kinase N-terminal 7TM domain-containing protein, partial [Patescibacteria group bacterium]|nr:histidine kinase N-terminal 7TM domain-containing protein [Patescibacteria group bacterium]
MPLSYQLIYFITAFLNLTIALGIYLRRPREQLVKAFAIFITSITAWIITLYFFYSISTQVEVIVVGRINFVFAELIAYFSFLFVYLFPEKTWRMPAWLSAALGIGTTLLCAVTFATDLVDQVEVIKGVSRITDYGPLYFLFVVEFISFSVASIALLIGKYRRFKGAARRQILLFALGWGGTLLMGITTNIVLPGLTGNYDVQNLGPISTLFLVVATAYAVARHELLNIKVLATEVFLVALLLLFVINSALSTSLSNQI